MPKKQTRPKGDPLPVRFSQETLADIAKTAAAMQLSTQEIVRLATDAGLEFLHGLDSRSLAKLLIASQSNKQMKASAKESEDNQHDARRVRALFEAAKHLQDIDQMWNPPDFDPVKSEERAHRSRRLKLSEAILRKTISKPQPPNG